MININNNQYWVTFAKLSRKHHPRGEGKRGEGEEAEAEAAVGGRERDWMKQEKWREERKLEGKEDRERDGRDLTTLNYWSSLQHHTSAITDLR